MDEQTTTTPSWGAPPPPVSRPGFSWGDFFAFRFMITPSIIRVIYVVGVVLITITSLVGMNGFLFGGGIVGALILFIFGNLYLRVLLELLVVFFGMLESLRNIERQGRR